MGETTTAVESQSTESTTAAGEGTGVSAAAKGTTDTPAGKSALAAAAAGESSDVKQQDGDGAKADEGKKPVTLELKLPEGFKVDEKAVEGFKGLALEAGLDAPKAQKLFDHFVKVQQEAAKADLDTFNAQDARWAKEIRADKDIGGANWKASEQHMARAVAKYGGKDLAALLDTAGLGNHPVLVKAFVSIGRALGEDTVAGIQPAAGAKSEEQLLRNKYPSMYPKES